MFIDGYNYVLYEFLSYYICTLVVSSYYIGIDITNIVFVHISIDLTVVTCDKIYNNKNSILYYDNHAKIPYSINQSIFSRFNYFIIITACICLQSNPLV